MQCSLHCSFFSSLPSSRSVVSSSPRSRSHLTPSSSGCSLRRYLALEERQGPLTFCATLLFLLLRSSFLLSFLRISQALLRDATIRWAERKAGAKHPSSFALPFLLVSGWSSFPPLLSRSSLALLFLLLPFSLPAPFIS